MIKCIFIGLLFGVVSISWDTWRNLDFEKPNEWNEGFYFGVIMALWLLWLSQCTR